MDIEEVVDNTIGIDDGANPNANGDVVNDIDEAEQLMKPESKPSESELESKQLEADEVKTENIEVFEDTSHSILFAAQAVEQACESVKKIQKYVGALLSFDETAQYLNLALKCCQDADKAYTEAASVWQQIQRQGITPADIKEQEDFEAVIKKSGVKKEWNEEDNIDDYNDINDFMDFDDADNDPDFTLTKTEESDFYTTLKGEEKDYEKITIDEEQEIKQEFTCTFEDCDYTSKDRYNFCKHTFNIHQKRIRRRPKNNDDTIELDEETERLQLFTCQFEGCTYSGADRKQFCRHTWTKHQKRILRRPFNKPRYKKTHPCQLCNYSFTKDEDLRKHTKKVHKEVTLKCLVCGDMFMGDAERRLDEHMAEKHPDAPERPKTKGYWDQFYKELDGVQECLLCDFKTNNFDGQRKFPLSKIRTHVKTHVLPKKTEKCAECDFERVIKNGISKMNEHIDSVHRGITYPCPIPGCAHKSKQQRNLKKHIDTVHDKIPLQCKKCPFTAKNEYHLGVHMKTDHIIPEEEKVYCDQCTYFGHNQHSLNVHKKKIHETKRTYATDKNGHRIYKCEHCPYSSIHYGVFKTHNQNKHQEHNVMCDKCNYTTGSQMNLKRHLQKEHGELLMCDTCDFTTKSTEQLSRHKRKHEGLTLTCEYEGCASVFTFKSNYLIHVNAVHKKIRHYCPECDFSSARKGDLNRHVRKVHGADSDQVFKCYKCVFSTSLKSYLIDHIKENHGQTQDEIVKLEEMNSHELQNDLYLKSGQR